MCVKLFFLATIELYEGNTQANSTVWTSFDAPPLPAIEQQAYIIPATIVSMRETITEKGITNKHVLSKCIRQFQIVLPKFQANTFPIHFLACAATLNL